MKFLRKCQLAIEVNPDSTGQAQNNLVIPEQFTVEFEISRQSLGSSQEATFRIENLGEKTRDLIYKDPYALTEYRAIQFRAGYESDPFLPLCFNGYIRDASSYHGSGATEFITEIHAYDGGVTMANGFTSQTIVSGTTVQEILQKLAAQLPRVNGQPIIGAFPDTNKRGKVLFGPTWNVLLEESGGLAVIDNGQVKILNYDEAIQALIPVINASSGLLGVPRRTATKLEFEMLFEPRLTIGQIVQLQSTGNKIFNGQYKVMGFTHRGVISPTKAGECRSLVSLFLGPGELKVIAGNVVQ